MSVSHSDKGNGGISGEREYNINDPADGHNDTAD